MSISLRLSDEDFALIKEYAQLHHISVSDLVRQAVLEKIEDEIDLETYHEAMKEYEKDSTTYTLDEVKKELELN